MSKTPSPAGSLSTQEKSASNTKASASEKTLTDAPASGVNPQTTTLPPAHIKSAEEIAADEKAARDDFEARDKARIEEEKARVDNALNNMSDADKAALVAPATVRLYGDPNPAPGAAGYEPPKLNPEPGSVEFALAHPGDLTAGAIDRDAAKDLKPHEEVREEKDAKEKTA